MALTEWPTQDDVLEIQLSTDFEDVIGVALERAVLGATVRAEIGAARPDVVEQYNPIFVGERWRDVPPHRLIAAVPVGKEHRLRTTPEQGDVVPREHRH
jgi:hypothetical protein